MENVVIDSGKSNSQTIAIKIVLFILGIPMYFCLGTYYFVKYTVLKPISFIGNLFVNVYYFLFTSSKVKKEAVVNYKSAETYASEAIKALDEVDKSKSIYQKMKENRKNASKIKQEINIDIKNNKKLVNDRNALLKSISDKSAPRLEKPVTFLYTALTPTGKVEKSTFVGVSKLDIYTFLTGEGYTVFSIKTSKWINFLYGDSKINTSKLSTKQIIFFLSQLETYIKAGVTLTEAMRLISKQLSKHHKERQIMQSVVYYLTMGESFSNALSYQGKAFPPLLINMIKAAEATGTLDETLSDMDDYYTEINKTKKEMISAMSYPILVTLFAIVVVSIIMIKIIPKFIGIYESAGASINGLTLFIIGASEFLRDYALVILLVFILLIVLYVMAYKNSKMFRRQAQEFAMKLPVFGKIIIYNEITIFTKTFASLLKNNVFITESIDILSKITNNELYKDIMLDTINNIAKGGKISSSFKNQWAVPDMAYYMIVTGENTGQLAEMMNKVSEYYQSEHKAMVEAMKTLIEPLMIVFLAVVVGAILLAVVLPMFNLYSSIV